MSFYEEIFAVYAVDDFTVKTGKTKDVMETKEMPGYIKGYSDFTENGVSIVTKLKGPTNDCLVQTIISHLDKKGKSSIQLTNYSNETWKIRRGQMLDCVDMRSCGYFHIIRDTLESVIKSSFKENCSLLTEEETEQSLDLYNKNH